MVDKKETEVVELFHSIRGKFIMSQALVIAIKELEKVDYEFREVSNINDMKSLLELFPIYTLVGAAEEQMRGKKR